jgi:hypothetical protein
MSFKLKALVLTAIAATTMSGAANALTNNEMFLVAYDSVASKTFVAALGGAGSVSAFTGGANLSVNYGSDANWTNFMSGATASNISYQVIGFYSSNPSQASSYNAGDKIVTTSNMTQPLPQLRNSAYNALMADMVSGAGINGGFQALNSTITGTSTGLILGSGSDSGAAVGSNLFTKYNAFDATAVLGTDLGFYGITRGASGNLVDSVKTQYLQGAVGSAIDTWNLSSAGVLTYTAVAAVPEADTSAMMIAGIGLMGFIARRRKNA